MSAVKVTQRIRRGSVLAVSLSWAMLGMAAGCGDSANRVPLHPTSGKVLVDGAPAKGVEVRFYRTDQLNDIDALRPFATTGEDGGFQVGAYEKGDGAPAGRYKVTLFWTDRPPGSEPGPDVLGNQYTNAANSSLEVTISEGNNALTPFEVKKGARPAAKPTPKSSKPDPDGLGES